MDVIELLREGPTAPQRWQAELEAAVGAGLDEATTHALVALCDERKRVRKRLASSLCALAAWGDPSPELVAVTLRLSADSSRFVRDWACFALGTPWRDVDGDDVRDALAARLDDPDDDTRCEALYGLAARRDPRVLAPLRAALSRPDGRRWRMEALAAGALGDPALHDLLDPASGGWDEDPDPENLAWRLTDPAGVGDDVLDGVTQLYRRRAHGVPDGEALGWWRLMTALLEHAPHRAGEFYDAVLARLDDDPAAAEQLRTHSALAVDAGLLPGA